MISWHKPGQKVACIHDGSRWPSGFFPDAPGPTNGDICTIAVVVPLFNATYFELAEWAGQGIYISTEFRPVYPSVIEDLKRMSAPIKERETEPA